MRYYIPITEKRSKQRWIVVVDSQAKAPDGLEIYPWDGVWLDYTSCCATPPLSEETLEEIRDVLLGEEFEVSPRSYTRGEVLVP